MIRISKLLEADGAFRADAQVGRGGGQARLQVSPPPLLHHHRNRFHRQNLIYHQPSISSNMLPTNEQV